MIDLQYAKKAFENYLNDYDQKNEKIKLKIYDRSDTEWLYLAGIYAG